MSCAITRPDPKTLYDFTKNQFSQDVLGGAPVQPESTEWFVVNNQYLGSEWYFSISEQALAQTRPETMCADNLQAYFANYGIYPLGAQFARGYIQLAGFTPGAAIPATETVTFGANQYAIDPLSNPPTVIGQDGTAIIMVQAIVPGEAANATGAVGSLDQPLVGLAGTVTAYGAQFCNGAEAQTPEQFRTYALARQATVPNDDFNWLVNTAKQWPCLTRVCRRVSNCCNTNRVEAYVFFDQSFANGLAPQSVVDDVSRWLFGSRIGAGDGKARIGLFGKLFTAAAYPVNITVTGLTGVTAAQWAAIQVQFAALFANRCPGEVVCRKWFEAIVTSVSPGNCSFTINLSGQLQPGLTCDGDVNPSLDYLPVLGNIYGGPTSACSAL